VPVEVAAGAFVVLPPRWSPGPSGVESSVVAENRCVRHVVEVNMLRKYSRLAIGVLGAAALVLGWSPTALADQAFHTTKYPLSSVADGSVHGWVIDIHAQGPRIYAHERYQLRDVAPPGQTCVMNLYAYSDPNCSDLVVPVPGMATMTANVSGNAEGPRVAVALD
jgi:hypothetical protein